MYKTCADWDANIWEVIDLATMKPIKKVRWANDKSGHYAVYKFDKNGETIWNEKTREVESIIIKKPIKLKRKKLSFYHKFIYKTIIFLTVILREI